VKDFLLELRATDKVKERPVKETDKQQTDQEASFFFETQLNNYRDCSPPPLF
jgi:hypothetical protein